MTTTIKDLVDAKIIKLRDVNALGPQEIAQETIELSSLYASINKELIERKMTYNILRKNLLEQYGKAALTKIRAEATPEYRALIEAEAYSESVLEMIRATKRAVALAEHELKEAKY